jgi:sensor c-di-GMP phosphodiesterase-like protein
LAKWADRRGDTSMPGEFKELAQRAKTMIDLTSQIGKFEEMLRDLRDQRDALVEQTTEQRATISAQNSMIASLRGQKAA